MSVLYSYLGLAEAELTHYLAGTHTSCHLGNIMTSKNEVWSKKDVVTVGLKTPFC